MIEIRWNDSVNGRCVFMRPGLAADAPAALEGEGWHGFELITTERALGVAGGIAEAAEEVHLVAPGQVPDVSAAILGDVGSEQLVAVGGGRVIDAAKAVAAVKGGRVAAIPTTLSGAEMTALHRLPAGHEGLSGVRPALVLADADLMTSLPEEHLRASAMNALAHGADSLYTPLADEASRKNALRGAGLIATSLDAPPDERDRGDLALGSLLCAQAVDAAGFAIHHVMSQTTVRVCETPHAATNAAILPMVMAEMRRRVRAEIEALAEALGTDSGSLPQRIEELGGGRRGLSEIGADRSCIEPVLDAAMARPELEHMTPGVVTRADLARIVDRAW